MFLQTLEQMQVRDRWVHEQLVQQGAAHWTRLLCQPRHTRHSQLFHFTMADTVSSGVEQHSGTSLVVNHAAGVPLMMQSEAVQRPGGALLQGVRLRLQEQKPGQGGGEGETMATAAVRQQRQQQLAALPAKLQPPPLYKQQAGISQQQQQLVPCVL